MSDVAGRWFGELRGAFASGAATIALFALGPLFGALWFAARAPTLAELVVDDGPSRPPVVFSTTSPAAIDTLGDGGLLDGPKSAGPEPAGSDGDGNSDATVDATGEDGADDQSAATSPAEGVVAGPGPRSTAARVARGPRTPGARGPAELSDAFRDGVARTRGRNTCRDSHPDVKPSGADRWDVNRNLVAYYTANFKRFNSLGWSGPYESDTMKGWKIGGFGCNSPLYHAGLRRGDVLLSVNERPTRTWLQIFGAYTRLKRHDDFDVVVVRRGKTKVLHYTLFEGGDPTTEDPTAVAPTAADPRPPPPPDAPTPG